MNPPSELFSDSGPIHGVRGPIDGVLIQPRTMGRAAEHRRFPAGTPVQSFRPEHGWPTDRILVVEHDDIAYVRRLCSEDGEIIDDFVQGTGKRATLAQETVLGLDSGANTHLTLEAGQAVHVYRQAGGRMWATTPDGAWNTCFDDDADPVEQCIRIEAVDLVRLASMPEGELHAQAAPVDAGHLYQQPRRAPKRLTF